MPSSPADFQHNNQLCILSRPQARYCFKISQDNLIQYAIYFSTRHCIDSTWLNDRDQFLFPNDGWQNDKSFQSDCLIFTLFHGQNRITSEQGVNHWIPFTEAQTGCKKAFKSDFMSKFINGEVSFQTTSGLFANDKPMKTQKATLSPEAQSVYDAGLALWRHYHSQRNANPDASFYDIRKHFQGVTKGRMNNSSADETYNKLIGDLRDKMKPLAKRIAAKVYKYGFLK